MLKEYLESIKKLNDNNLYNGDSGLHMSANKSELYEIHKKICTIRVSWYQVIND